MIGIHNIFRVAANVTVTNSDVLVTSTLTANIAAAQIAIVRVFLQFSVGATGGVRWQLVVPAAPTRVQGAIMLVNTVAATTVVPAVQTSSAAFTNALANAGTHYAYAEYDVVNGTTAGTIDLQFAQNTADALTLTLLQGSRMEVIYVS
jgi:hypothetical protein